MINVDRYIGQEINLIVFKYRLTIFSTDEALNTSSYVQILII